MYRSALDIYVSVVAWIMLVAVAAFAGFHAWTFREALLPVLPAMLVFGLGSAISARIAIGAAGGRAVRVTLCFVLAAIYLLPAPGGLLVAIVAVIAGLGAGVAGTHGPGPVAGSAVLVATALAQFLHAAGRSVPDPGSLAALGHLLLLFLLIQGFALGIATVVASGTGRPVPSSSAPTVKGMLMEAACVPLAWTLIALFSQAGWFPFTALCALVLLAAVGLRNLDRAVRGLDQTQDELTARVTELGTLHAIGKEILSSPDQDRILRIVDRECRKIFDIDLFFIALSDRDTQQFTIVHHRRGQRVTRPGRPLGARLSAWMISEKKGIRMTGGPGATRAFPFRGELDREMRSILAVPMIVEDVVIGVLSIQSRRPDAYTESQLSLLSTIGQQAAVAIENARHYQMATVDSLTGLFVREYFFRRLEGEHGRAQRYHGSFGLLMVDLDGFKEINDRHGHLVGDRYLRAFGSLIRSRLRAADLACRFGGDEFCILLPETDLEGSQVIAERLRLAVSRLVVPVDTLAIRTTVSIGVASFPTHDSRDLKSLLRKADEALYRAKRLGRDRVVPWAA
jgi:diguanylate cyclase (GGDEF)-like protein